MTKLIQPGSVTEVDSIGPSHTPPPYVLHEGAFLTEGAYITIWDARGNKVGNVLKRDAHFIVRACNSHEALCAALELFADLLFDDYPPGSEDVFKLEVAAAADVMRARAALKLARGEA